MEITKFVYFGFLILNFLIFSLIKFYTIFKKLKNIINFSKKKYFVFNAKSNQVFTPKSIFEISIGDIIKLEKDDIVPREMLIISGPSGSCFKENILVDKSLVDSKLLIERRNSIKKFKATTELNCDLDFKNYLQSFTATLKYLKTNNLDEIEGILKFKKDPKPEEFKKDKILEKDLIIRSRWILGIVLYKENFFENYFKELKKENHIEYMINKYYGILEILFLVFFWIFFIFVQKFYELKFKILIDMAFSLCSVLPLNLEVFIFIINIYFSSKFESRLIPLLKTKTRKISIHNARSLSLKAQENKKKDEIKRKIFKIINPKVICNFGNVDSVVFTKNDFMIKKKILIQSIYFKNNYFSIDYIKSSRRSFVIEDFEKKSFYDKTPKKKMDSEIPFINSFSEIKGNISIFEFPSLDSNSPFQTPQKSNFKKDSKKLLHKVLIKNTNKISPKNNEDNNYNFSDYINNHKNNLESNDINLKTENYSRINDVPLTPKSNRNNEIVNDEKSENKMEKIFLKYKQQNKTGNEEITEKTDINMIELKLKEESKNDDLIEKIPELKEILLDLIPIDPSFLYLNGMNINSYSYKDQAFLVFRKLFNVNISSVEYNSTIVYFSIVQKGFQENKKFNVFIVPVKNEEDVLKFYIIEKEKVTLFAKLHKISDLPLFLNDKNDLFYLRKIVKNNELKSLETIIFLKKELTLKDSTFIRNHLKNLKKKAKNPISFFETACGNNWKNMNLFAAFGLKEKVEKNVLLIDNLTEAKVRLVYLSGDNYNNTVNALSAFSLLEEENFFTISFTNEKKGLIIFQDFYKKHQNFFENLNDHKNDIENFQEEFFKEQKFIIFLNNASLKTIKENPYLYFNLKFIMKFSKTIIGYNFNSENNAFMVELLKQISPHFSVMAIGSFNKDIDMVKRADVGVQYLLKDSYKLFGDVVINDINSLNNIIFHQSQLFYKNCVIFILFVFYNSVLTLFFIFFYFMYKLDNDVIFPNLGFLIRKDIFVYILGIFLINNKKDFFEIPFQRFKTLYQRIKLYQQNLQFLIMIDFVEAFIVALFIFFFNKLLFFLIFDKLTEYHFNFYILLLNFTVIFTKAFYVNNMFKAGYFIVLILFFILSFLLLMLVCYLQEEFLEWEELILFLKNGYFYIGLIPNFIFISLLLFLMNYFIRRKKIEFCKRKIEINEQENEKVIILKFFKGMFFSLKMFFLHNIIFKIFKAKENIEPMLLNTILPFNELSKKKHINNFFLSFKNKFIKKSFEKTSNRHFLKKNKINFSVYFIFICSLIIIGAFDNYKIYDKFFSIVFTFCGLFIFLIIDYFKLYLKNFLIIILLIIYGVILITMDNHFEILILMNTFYIFFLLDFENLGFQFYCVIFFMIFGANFFYYFTEFFHQSKNSLFFMYLLMMLLKIFSMVVYIRKKIVLKKKTFILKSRLRHKKNYNNELLTFLMPKFVLNRISYDVSEVNLADDAGYVTVLFADICDFDKMIKDYGNDIVGKLDSIYKEFDTMCEKYGAQKIETVGKTYMAVTGLEIVEENLSEKLKSIDTSKRMIDLAMALNNIISTYKDYNGKSLNLKIGINRGKVMMGVIGYHKPQFSLIGDSVNTTSRLCSTGEKSHIMLSEEFFIQIKDYQFDKGIVVEKRLTFMKGKGDVPVYHIFRKENKFRNKLFNAISNKSLSNSKTNNHDLDFEKLAKLSKYKEKKRDMMDMFHLIKRFGQNNFFRFFQIEETEEDIEKMKENKSFLKKKTRAKRSTDNYDSVVIEKKNNTKNKIINILEQFEFQNINFRSYPFFNLEKNPFNIKFTEFCDQKFLFKNQLLALVIIMISSIQLVYLGINNYLEDFYHCVIFFFKCIILLLFFLLIILGKVFFKFRYKFIFKALFFLLLTILNLQNYSEISNFIFTKYFYLIEELIIFTFMSFSHLVRIRDFFGLYIYNILFKIITLLLVNFTVDSMKTNLINNIYLLFFCLFLEISLLINKMSFFKLIISYFNNLYLERQKNTQINDFINRLMPEHIQQILKNPKSKLAEEYKNVTIIFADIVGFTAYSAGKKPKEVVLMLSKLFTDFDKACNQLDIFKVYTIGDCYVALGFVDKSNRLPVCEEAYKITQFAFRMIEIIEKVKAAIKFDGLNMRIGIHTGNIIGGVIGTDIIRFDIYGENVLIANKMESQGYQGKINISQQTKHILENNYSEFSFENNGILNIGKKEISMFFIEKN